MLTLAIDTSGRAGSVAVLSGGNVLSERGLHREGRTAQTLAPAIVEALAEAGVKPADIRLVATTVGPGSFTGLRIGITAAKTFAYAVGAEVLGTSTLEGIAHQCSPLAPHAEIHAVLDAQRKELFLARFRAEKLSAQDLPRLTRLSADAIITAEDWLAALPAGAVVTGSGLSRLIDHLPATTLITLQAQWELRAATVGRLALRDFQAGRRDDLWKLAPVYLRPSYAEEKARRN